MSRQIVDEPKKIRPCTDICCVVTFLLLIGLFIVLGIYEISEYGKLPKPTETPLNGDISDTF